MTPCWRPEVPGPGDDVALAALARRALGDPWSVAGFAAEQANAHARVRLVRAADVVVGYLVAHLVADEVEVASIAVDPEWRRRGIARALLVDLLDEARAAGARVAHLEVATGSDAARALYARLGFCETGRRTRYYADGSDAIRMRLSMGGSAESGDGAAKSAGAPRGSRP